MNRFDALKRWTWSIFVTSLLAFALAGCEGDDGAPGADGTDGADGLSCWDLNENGEKDFPDEDTNGDGEINVDDCRDIGGPPPVASAIESCGTCHGDNAIASAAEVHALTGVPTVSNVAFAAAGADLEISYNLAIDGAAVDDATVVANAHLYNAANAENVDIADATTIVSGGGGAYTATVTDGVALAGAASRFLLTVGNEASSLAAVSGDYPAEAYPEVVADAACNNCHGPTGIDPHPTFGYVGMVASQCVVCHEDENGFYGTTLFPESYNGFFDLVHGIHNAHNFPEGFYQFDPDDPESVFDTTYPTYMNNCSVCHSEEAQLTAANSMPFTGEGCFSCHGSVEGIPFPDDATANLHSSVTEATDCQQCHSASGLAPDYQVVADSHNGATTERSGVIWDGVDTSVTEGALIEWLITDVADDGTNLTITWEASYDGTGVDPCNATAGAGAPVFFADDDGNLSILRNYAQGEDFILGTNPDGAGQPGGDVDVDATNTTCAGNVATTVVPVEETEAMYGRVAIQGKPRLPSPDPDDEDGLMQVRAKTPTYDWVVGTGGAAPERRAVVDTGLCLNCHVGSLYQHGGNRVDNVDMCILCHNVAANDEYVRVDNFGGVDASESYDGRAGQAFGIKELAHGIHPAGATGNPIVIYRGRGIYAWATDESQLQNWPTEDNCTRTNGSPGRTVVGSDPATATSDTCQPHNFHAPTYPRGLYDCAACHVEDVALLPDPTKAMATTVEAGEPPFGDQLNDVLQGVQTTSCVTCHADSAAKGHAYQNGWTPQAFPEGRQTIIDAN